jgi:hypothetical protein
MPLHQPHWFPTPRAYASRGRAPRGRGGKPSASGRQYGVATSKDVRVRRTHDARNGHSVLVYPLLGSLLLALTGCGALAKHANTALTQGNWSVTASSSNPAIRTFHVGGNLAQSGNTLSGTMYVFGSLCFDVSQPISLTGTVNGQQVRLASKDINGQVFSVEAIATTDSALKGTYTITGGCGNGDSGTAAANAVPSISGTWGGSLTGSGGSQVALSIELAQNALASADGSFALTGDLVYAGSSCSVSGTITSAFVAGSYILLNANTVETDGSVGNVFYTNVLLDDSQNPQNMLGAYQVDFGLCADDMQVLTLSKVAK